MSGHTVEVVLGRLIEIRIGSGFHTTGDVDELFEQIATAVRGRQPPSERWVNVADWRRCTIMSDEAAARFLRAMTAGNSRLVRSAVLASYESPSAVMQFVRMVRQSGTADRRLFFDEESLGRWLGEVLTATERARLHRFLSESRPAEAQRIS